MTVHSLGWVDWALFAVLLLSAVVGLWRGVLFEVLSLLGWVAAYIAAQALSSTVAPLLPVGAPDGAVNQGAAFALVFVLSLVVWTLLSRLLRLIVHATPLQLIDRVLGGGFGVLRGVVLLLAFTTVVSLTPAARSPHWQASQGAGMLAGLLQALKPMLPNAVSRHLQARMNHPRSGFAAPPQGGTASGPAKPDPRRLLGKTPVHVPWVARRAVEQLT